MPKRPRKTLGVIGIPKLTRALKDVRESVDLERIQGIYLAGARIVGTAIQRNAPVGTDPNMFPSKIRDAVEIGVFKRRRNLADAAFARVNPNKAPHALWHEFGTSDREHKSGKSVGRIQATNFVAKAKNSSRAPVRAVLFKGVEAEIKKAWARGG